MWLYFLSIFNFFIIVSTLDCSVEPDGIYELGCKSFQKCVHGNLVGLECHEHFVYNSKIQDCDDPAKVAAPCGHMMDCTNKADGHYPDLDQGCHTYYTCSGGIFFGHNYCPAGLVFNFVNGVCDWKQNVPIPCGSAIPTVLPTTDTSTVHTTVASTVTATTPSPTDAVTTTPTTETNTATQPLKTISISHSVIYATVNKQD